MEVNVSKFPWAASGRALTLNRTDGLTKLITDKGTGECRRRNCRTAGGELISESVLAIEMGATAEDIAFSIHPHPTLTETIMEAAEGIYGASTHIMKSVRGRSHGRYGTEKRLDIINPGMWEDAAAGFLARTGGI